VAQLPRREAGGDVSSGVFAARSAAEGGGVEGLAASDGRAWAYATEKKFLRPICTDTHRSNTLPMGVKISTDILHPGANQYH
jgi:hypothetical protein